MYIVSTLDINYHLHLCMAFYETLSQGQYTRQCLSRKIKAYKSGICEEYGGKIIRIVGAIQIAKHPEIVDIEW